MHDRRGSKSGAVNSIQKFGAAVRRPLAGVLNSKARNMTWAGAELGMLAFFANAIMVSHVSDLALRHSLLRSSITSILRVQCDLACSLSIMWRVSLTPAACMEFSSIFWHMIWPLHSSSHMTMWCTADLWLHLHNDCEGSFSDQSIDYFHPNSLYYSR